MKVVSAFQKIHRCEFIKKFDVGFGFRGRRNCRKLAPDAFIFLDIGIYRNFFLAHSRLLLTIGKQTGNSVYYGLWNHGDYPQIKYPSIPAYWNSVWPEELGYSYMWTSLGLQGNGIKTKHPRLHFGLYFNYLDRRLLNVGNIETVATNSIKSVVIKLNLPWL